MDNGPVEIVWIYLSKMVMFHGYVNVYQRVSIVCVRNSVFCLVPPLLFFLEHDDSPVDGLAGMCFSPNFPDFCPRIPREMELKKWDDGIEYKTYLSENKLSAKFHGLSQILFPFKHFHAGFNPPLSYWEAATS